MDDHKVLSLKWWVDAQKFRFLNNKMYDTELQELRKIPEWVSWEAQHTLDKTWKSYVNVLQDLSSLDPSILTNIFKE
jgi:hypothetical protein